MSAVRLPDKIEHVAIALLVPYARNARTHSDAQVAQIAASMREFGWTNPVLIDEAGGIIAGHGRVLAAQQLGIAAVPCVRLAGLSEAQKRALILADNKLAENAGWDEVLLAEELSALAGMRFELGLVGFSDDELKKIFIDPEMADEMPAVPAGAKSDYVQMTYTVHIEQAAAIKAAIKHANEMHPKNENKNRNGSALAYICQQYIAQNNGVARQ